MRLGAIVLAILGALPATADASADQTYSSSQFKKIIAQATIPDRNNEQIYFNVIAGTLWNESQKWISSDGIYYQFTGTVGLILDGKTTTLNPGEGIFRAISG
jgi:hypothetical protein